MAALTVALAVTAVVLLVLLATASLLAYGYATALAATTAERDEARDDLRTAHREERRLRAELEQRAVASAVLTPDAERPWPLWGHRTLRDIHTARSAADFDRKDQR
ncbi:hypothetical protein [Micromonospora sp. NPDC023633]|uniref:hypothetical protein n=1 Tax=Micromonospora sp. NPDC023633 TaxID=3154320 RepID=UPI0034117FA0